MDAKILSALKNLHEKVWAEVNAECGTEFRAAKMETDDAAYQLENTLGTINPRDVKEYDEANFPRQ